MTEAEQFLAERGLDVARMDGYARMATDWNLDSHRHQWIVRDEHISRFGFAVLTADAIKAITPYGPLLEIGCGCGYWSFELRRAGIDVIATDPGLGRYRFLGQAGHWERLWVDDIERVSGEDAVKKYPQRNLLIIWPDYGDSWPVECLRAFAGKTVLYGGEWMGCTADEEFHSHLEAHFTRKETISLPQFDGIHDALEVWERSA